MRYSCGLTRGYPPFPSDIIGVLRRGFGLRDTDSRSDSACRRRKSSIIARTSPLNCRAYSSRMRRTSERIGSRTIVVTHELIRSTYYRHRETENVAYIMNYRLERCISNMCAVPCKQVVHAVNDRDGNVGSVDQRTIWKSKTIDQRQSDFIGFGQRVEHGNSIENPKPPYHRIGITCRSFEQDCVRNEKLKEFAPFVPPLAGGLLLGSHHKLRTTPSSQIAGDRSLDVNR